MSQAIPFRGVLLDQQTITALLLAESFLGYQLSLPQGSFNAGGVAASAGTHDGGGAMDVSVSSGADSFATQVAKVHALRRAGFAAWRRTPAEGFVYHIHCILLGDPLVSSSAAQQVTQWHQGLNGLADQAPDTDSVDVAAGRPTVGPAPTPHPPAVAQAEEAIIVTYPRVTPGWKGDFLFADGRLTHILTFAAEAALKGVGVPVRAVSAADFAALYAAYGS